MNPPSPPPSPILATHALTVTRGKTHILRALDWRIDRGQHWVVLGPNGAGKTTLLRSLTGYLSPTSGRIEVLGQVHGRSDWRDLRAKVGVVTSAFGHAIPPAETALETIVSGRTGQLDLWHAPRRAERASALALLRFVRLGGRLAARPWAFLSQGERQRVLIARALMAKPRLLILDEPCAGLDPAARERLLRFIDHLATRPRSPTIVLVTHHVEEITPAFTHALLLRQGKVHAAGPVKKTLTSKNLSKTFDTPLRLRKFQARYNLSYASYASYKS